MASSLYDTYGSLSIKNLKIDESGIKMHNNADDTKYAELKCDAPTGQHVHVFPNTSGTVLNSASSLDASKVGVTSLTAVDSLANADEFMLYDATASANRKVSAADLATFCGGGSGLPAATSGQILVYGTEWDNVDMSGHVAIASNGATTIQNNTVTNDMLTGSIAYGKLSLNNAIQNGDLAGSIAYGKLSLNNAIQNGDLAGSIQYNKLSLSNSVTNGDLAGSIENEKISALNGVTAGTVAASRAVVVDSNKDIGDFRNVKAVEFNIQDQWRFVVSGGNLLAQFKNGASWETKHTFASN